MIVARERLLRVGLRYRRGHAEHARGAGAAGDHLAALGEADDDVVDVEAFEGVPLATLGAVPVAIGSGKAVDVVEIPVRDVVEVEPVSGDKRDGARERHLRATGDRLNRRRPGDPRAGDDHPLPQAGDTVERHDRTGRRGHRLDFVGRGPLCGRVHLTGRAEIEAELDVRLPGPGAEIDAGLPPAAGGIEQLLHRLIGRSARRRRGRERVGEFGIHVVKRRLRAVVRRNHFPRQTVVDRDEDTGAVAHRVVVPVALGVLGVEEVVEIERRLVGEGVAREAEGVGDKAPLGAAGEVVVVADLGVGRELLLPVESSRVEDTVLGVRASGIEPVVGIVAVDVSLESEVHTGATFPHVTSGP